MEYSLQNLNKTAYLNHITTTQIIDTLNLIGFEVDEIFLEKSLINSFSYNIKFLIKIPSNREDLLNENFFLEDLSSILVFKFYKTWQKISSNYYAILKKKYIENYNFESINIDSKMSDVLIYSIKINPLNYLYSPLWIQNKLKSLGLPFKNDISDIFELVKMEWGQTFQILKAKDFKALNLKKLDCNKIFKNIDEKQYNLKKGTIILTNEKNDILNFLGLIDLNLEDSETSELLVTGIYYDIHKNSIKINPLESEVSLRYLRNTFLENFKFAFQRLLTLLELIYSIKCNAKIYSHLKLPTKVNLKRILKLKKESLKNTLNIANFNQEIFKKAGLKIVCRTKEEIYFEIPNYRNDLKREIDLIEEYSRFIGYKNFSEIMPVKQFLYSNIKENNVEYIKQFFLNYGFSEILTNPLKNKDFKKDCSIIITNPLTSDLSYLRTELLSELVFNFETNLRLTNESINLFEIGRVFQKTEKGMIEMDKLGGIFQIERLKKGQSLNTEWFSAKGFIENFLKNFGYNEDNIIIDKIDNKSLMLHRTKSINIKFKNRIIGVFGEITPKFEKLKGNKYAIYLFEFNLEYFKKWRINSIVPIYEESSKLPIIIKDISFKIKKTTNFSKLKSEIKMQSSFLKEISFFDIYFEEKDISLLNVGIRLFFEFTSQILKTEDIEFEIAKILSYLSSTC